MPVATVRGRRLHYEEKGSGFPVLFGHSYLWDHGMWSGITGMLSSRFRCIMPDLWSHGASDPLPETSTNLDRLADDHRLFMEALGIPRFAVAGLSVGGMWAPRLALGFPDRVAALVLMNTAAGPEPDLSMTRYMGMLDQVEKAGAVPAPIQKAIQPFFFSEETLRDNPSLSAGFMSSLSHIKPGNIPGVVALGRAIFSRDSILFRLENIKCPTLLVAGENDRSRPPQEAQEMARLIPGSRLEVLPGIGHMSVLEAPIATSRLLTDFLKTALLKERFL